MVRIVLAITALLALATPLRADQLAELRRNGQLVCGVTDILDPFSFPAPGSGTMSGYDVDVCGAIAKRLGVAVNYQPLPLSARIPELLDGHVDLLAAGLGYSPQRANRLRSAIATT